MFHKKAKTTKKIVLRLECTSCKTKLQLALKRCKHFELGYVPLLSPDKIFHPGINTNVHFSQTVETRRRRVLLLFSKFVPIWLLFCILSAGHFGVSSLFIYLLHLYQHHHHFYHYRRYPRRSCHDIPPFERPYEGLDSTSLSSQLMQIRYNTILYL